MECIRKYYAGIGSRETPKHIREQMTKLAAFLSERGYTLRSGGAEGADQAFEDGASRVQIWYPYAKNCPTDSSDGHEFIVIDPNDEEAFASVEKYHPLGDKLAKYIYPIMARNYRQLIGKDELDSDFVVCWTKDGSDSGGTGQAIRIARDKGIPIYNLFFEEHLSALYSALAIRDTFE